MKDKLDDTTRASLCSSSEMAAGRKILTLLSGHFVVGEFLGVMKFLQCSSFSPTYSPTLRQPIPVVHRYGVLCQIPTAITTNNKTTRKNNNSHRCWRKETAAAANTKNILAFVRHLNKRRLPEALLCVKTFRVVAGNTRGVDGMLYNYPLRTASAPWLCLWLAKGQRRVIMSGN